MEFEKLPPREVRALIREGTITGHTSGMCGGYAQANLAVLPAEYAYDFLLFTQRNPKSCPVLEVSDRGSRFLKAIAPGADIARDIPKYRIYKNGVPEGEYTDVSEFWRDDFVSFLIGCSFSFESELLAGDIPVRHIEEGRNVPMYITGIECERAGIFHGKMVVSMRPIPPELVVKSVTITASMPRVHGAPVHIGDPGVIGIGDLGKPDFGDAVTIKPGEVPVFWACGVTPQSAIMSARPSIAITHAPGHMLITDVKNLLLKY
ncbi:MAG: putative hydro-lyase [Spirochaetaceae bacterium]|jgi:uncharacterized protein YcsI (UPF0317 family)|nr:putative hydro-lyase [Spirochaetaceae bacterium]